MILNFYSIQEEKIALNPLKVAAVFECNLSEPDLMKSVSSFSIEEEHTSG